MSHLPGSVAPSGAESTSGSRSPGGRARNGRSDGTVTTTNGASNGNAPARARDLELLGRYAASGHRRSPSLVRRADGQIVQLTPVLYQVLEAIDGHRSFEAIATVVGERIGRNVGADDVRFLTEKKLRPLGVVRQEDGSAPASKKANPLLALRLRLVVTNPRITGLITAPFTKLFVPPIVFAVVVAFLLTTGWLFFAKGLAAPLHDAFYEPGLLLLVFLLTTLSAGFHELGHAAACRYGGAAPGAMGVGLYLVWPAFYTDVTDAYRLDRRGRLRVDLGGLYFNALFALAMFGLWAVVRWDALLIVIPLQLLQMMRQLIPFVRLDGYHILADLTGVPDLFAHIKPILLGLSPTRWGRAENKVLRPRVRLIVTMWVLVVLPILVLTFILIIAMFPRLVATAWDSLGLQWEALGGEWGEGSTTDAAARLLSIVALVIPILGITYLLTRVIRRTSRRVWRATSGRPVMRSIAVVVAAALAASVAVAWWPDGQYQPIGRNASGMPVDVRFRQLPIVDELLSSETSGPELRSALTLPVAGAADGPPIGIPSQADISSNNGPAPIPEPSASPGFRFTAPPKPGEGDNQALAMNHEDGSSIIDLAFSLLFVTDKVVDQDNEAWALASCNDCLAVAVAFQVLLILDQADVIVPENAAVAVNAYCNSCLTQALAMQLIITLTEPLSDEAMAELERIAARLEELEKTMSGASIDEIYAELLEIQSDILNLVVNEGAVASDSLDTAGEDSGDELLPSPQASLGTSPEPSASASAKPSSTPSSEPSPTPSGEPSPTPSGEPSPQPSPEPTP